MNEPFVQFADFQRDDVTDLSNCTDKLSTALQCKVVRIGTYRFEPKEPVSFLDVPKEYYKYKTVLLFSGDIYIKGCLPGSSFGQ